MNDWIHQTLQPGQTGFTVLGAVFLLGIIGSLASCCNPAIIGGISGYSGMIGSDPATKRRIILQGVSLLTGTVVSMAILGGLSGFVSAWLLRTVGNSWKIIAAAVSIFFGLYAMELLPFRIPTLKLQSGSTGKGFWGSLLFGFALGGVSTSCGIVCNPIFPLVLGVSFIKGNFIWGILILTLFGIGYGLPLALLLVGVGFGVGKLSSAFSGWNRVIRYVAGILLLGIGFYFLWTL
jgi:cytochrome c biogenesis protein CcdA